MPVWMGRCLRPIELNFRVRGAEGNSVFVFVELIGLVGLMKKGRVWSSKLAAVNNSINTTNSMNLKNT